MIVFYPAAIPTFLSSGAVPVPYSERSEAIKGYESMGSFNRVLFSLVCLMAAWPAVAADFYWSCTTPVGTRYADATQCDKGDTAIKVMKDGAAPAASSESAANSAGSAKKPPVVSSQQGAGSAASVVCPKDPSVCTRPDYEVNEGTARAQAITRFMRQKECEFMQRFPGRCAQSSPKMGS